MKLSLAIQSLAFLMASTSNFIPFAQANKDDEILPYILKYTDPLVLTQILATIPGSTLIRDISTLQVASISIARKFLPLIEALPLVETIDEDEPVTAFESITTTTNMLRGGGNRELAQSTPYGLIMVQADLMRTGLPTTPTPIKVCVVDTGYSNRHEDLPILDENSDGFSPYSDQQWNVDGHSHGTHVAGTIGAIGTNTIGVDSVLSDPADFTFFIGKGLTDSGSGSSSGVLQAVQACADNGAKVVNLSLGGSGYSATLENAYQNIFNQGVLLVAAAGNDGNSNYNYPASYKHLISVAAVSSNENKASFSQFNDQVELAGPGVGVQSTLPNNGYGSKSGTSMASPHVAGVAALVWSHFPQCSNLQIRNVLYKTAKDKGATGCDDDYGAGIVQAKAAYDLLLAVGCEEAGGPTPSTPSDGNVGGCGQGPNYSAPPTSAPTPFSCDDIVFTLELVTDNYPQETSFEIRDASTNAVVTSGSGFTSKGQQYMEARCLVRNGNFIFTIKDTYGDGICCQYGNGSYRILVGGIEVGSGGTFGSSESTSFSTGSGPTNSPVSPAPTPAPVTLAPVPAPTTPAPTPAPVQNCGLTGASCSSGGDCCSGTCSSFLFVFGRSCT